MKVEESWRELKMGDFGKNGKPTILAKSKAIGFPFSKNRLFSTFFIVSKQKKAPKNSEF